VTGTAKSRDVGAEGSSTEIKGLCCQITQQEKGYRYRKCPVCQLKSPVNGDFVILALTFVG
jgi:hypothetical protein